MALRIFEVASADDHRRCLGIRRAVFVHEQGVPEELEVVDEERCRHFLAVVVDDEAEPGRREVGAIATGRLLPLPEGLAKVQRLAVLPDWRGHGVGARLLAVIEEAAAASGFGELVMHAQVAVQAFYERQGYQAEGEIFEEAGIPHRLMRKRIEIPGQNHEEYEEHEG